MLKSLSAIITPTLSAIPGSNKKRKLSSKATNMQKVLEIFVAREENS